MTKLTTIFLTCVLMMLSIMASNAQDQRTLQTKVADILAQMPTNDLEHRDRVMKEMIDLGDDGFSEFVKLVKAPGKGNDAAVRVAINGAARYASKFGRKTARDFMETSLLNAINQAENKEVKAFFMHQIKLVATNKSVSVLKKYIDDDRLYDSAIQVLLDIKSPVAIKALDDALVLSSGKKQIRLVKAAAETRSTVNEKLIFNLAKSDDNILRKEALIALAEMGTSGAYMTIWNAAKKQNFAWSATGEVGALVVYAERLAQNGEIKLSEKIILNTLKAAKKNNKLTLASAVLRVYVMQIGTPAMSILLSEANSEHKAYRQSILHHVKNMGGVAETRQWVSVAQSASPDVKADIIDMLGRRGCSVALSYIKQELENNTEIVRLAAITAMAKLDGEDAVSVIIDHLARDKDVAHCQTTLLYLVDKAHIDPVAKAIDSVSGASKAALINVLANKCANQYFSKILALTNAEDVQVKTAAFNGLKRLAGAKDLDALIQLLLITNNTDAVKAVQMAVITSARQVKKADRLTLLLKAINSTNKKERIIFVLPYLGGKKALNAVTKLFETERYKNSALNALVNWNDHTASSALYAICKQRNSSAEKAFYGFLKQITKSTLSADQKLLQYRKIMPFALSVKAQNEVLKAIGKLRTITALVYVSKFLDNAELQQVASRSAMFIALPASGAKVGLYGEDVKAILEKAANVMSGAKSDYYKINIREYLKKMPSEKGFVSMFNGKDLSGWKGLVANPIKRSQMSKAQLAKAQKEANEKMRENWSVKNEAIVFNGDGANLCSVKEYADFEMIVDWRISPKGDSGIYLRGTPQVQIWDTSRTEVGAQVGSGGLYNNQKHKSKPLKVVDNPINEWNTFRIKMVGDKVTVYLNGELVVDNVTMENYWDRKLPIFPKGAIELQAHGTNLAFRDIYVREINDKEFNLTAKEKADGFQALFNGKNLDGWVGNKTDYRVEDGEIVIRPDKEGHGRGNLYTEKQYSDFIYRFEFKLTPGANNGLGIHAPLKGDAAYEGIELQILDNDAPIYANLKPYQYHGSVYGVIPAKRGFLKPLGQWNYEEVYVKGSHIKIVLNGTVIVDGDYLEASKNGTLDQRNHPGLKRKEGHIGFLGHGSVVKFRNIRIKDLRK